MLLNAGVFNSLTCKCASRHSGVQFLDIKPPKSGPYPSVFPHFDLQICFAPQRRGIFLTSERPKWVRDRCVLHILTYKCASCHSGVAFFNIGTSQNGSAHVVFCAFWLANVLRRHSRVAFWNIWTSKMAPGMWCFAHFDFQMCFSPQPRAIFLLSAEQLPPHPPL